jgi:hypothetical protein
VQIPSSDRLFHCSCKGHFPTDVTQNPRILQIIYKCLKKSQHTRAVVDLYLLFSISGVTALKSRSCGKMIGLRD